MDDEGAVVGVPIPGADDEVEGVEQLADRPCDQVALGHGQRPARAEIVLEVDNRRASTGPSVDPSWTPTAESPVAPVVDFTRSTVRIVGGRCRVRGRDERAWVRAQAGSVSDLEALFRSHWPAPIALPTWSSTTRPPRRTSPRKPFSRPSAPSTPSTAAALRPLAAPDRGQPGDRLGPRESAAAGGRRRSPPGCAAPPDSPPQTLVCRGGRGPRRPVPGPSRRDRPPLPARVHRARSPRCSAFRAERSIPVSAAAWTRSSQMSGRSVRDGSGAAQPGRRPRPGRARGGRACLGRGASGLRHARSGCPGSRGIRGQCWPSPRPSRSESPPSPRPAARSSSGCVRPPE